jgi:hypothetical protein
MTGTPKTLAQAIANGMEQKHKDTYELHENIQNHVTDFLAQKFGKALLVSTNQEATNIIQALWREVI